MKVSPGSLEEEIQYSTVLNQGSGFLTTIYNNSPGKYRARFISVVSNQEGLMNKITLGIKALNYTPSEYSITWDPHDS
jgi:hypothetical protein